MVAADGRADPVRVVRIRNHSGGNFFVALHERPRGQLASARCASFLYTCVCVSWVEVEVGNFNFIIMIVKNHHSRRDIGIINIIITSKFGFICGVASLGSPPS